MDIRTLEHSSTEEILDIFNDSFSGYFIPMKLSKQQLEGRMAANHVDLRLSVGAFEQDRMIGFMLHGTGQHQGLKAAYNAGTGVRSEHRGRRISTKLYDYAFPLLKASQFGKIILEVITMNEPAIAVYKLAGFSISRQLDSFKGSINLHENLPADIRPLEDWDWPMLQLSRDWEPSWQHSNEAMDKQKDTLAGIGIYENGILAGYLIYDPATARVQQFGVLRDQRRKGYGKALFSFIAKQYGREISLINVDHGSAVSRAFLQGIGLEVFLSQYEMTVIL